ncbi:hypothetical protein ACUH97_08080 [Dermabacteraceae bacterium P13088]
MIEILLVSLLLIALLLASTAAITTAAIAYREFLEAWDEWGKVREERDRRAMAAKAEGAGNE